MAKSEYKAYWVEKDDNGTFSNAVVMRGVDDLPAGDVLIRVHFSSLNYKDALSASGKPGVTREYPHTPGIDAAGIVEQSSSDKFAVGDEVIVTGYDLGMSTFGGFAEYIRVPAAWVIPLPEGLGLRDSMILGTAGLTAGLSVSKLLSNGVSTEERVAVTGATGGVGCIAVALLAKLGFDVDAVSGKTDAKVWLCSNGANSLINRDEYLSESKRVVLKPRWGGIVDTVGGDYIEQGLKQLAPGGSISCCGMVASPQFASSVFPFILRGVNLLGIDSVEISQQQKTGIWQKFAAEWKLDGLESLVNEIDLYQLSDQIDAILKGQVQGRVLVRLI